MAIRDIESKLSEVVSFEDIRLVQTRLGVTHVDDTHVLRKDGKFNIPT